MEHDPLAKLLRDADATAPRPLVQAAELVGRVRRKARRRRVAAAMTVAAFAVASAVGGMSTWRSPLTAEVDVARLRAECVRLADEADLHERVARAMVEREASAARRVAAVTARGRADAGEVLTAERERSAMILLFRADRLMREPDARAEAADAFRRVLELFPQSRGAALARERLDRIGA